MMTIDASEVIKFGADAAAAPAILEEEAAIANEALVTEGMGLAQDNVQVDNGDLKAGIAVWETSAWEGEYGVRDIEYAWMREEGGIILPRNAQALVFEIEGALIIASIVVQDGNKYMERSGDELESRIGPAYEAALGRTIARIGG